MLLTRLAPKTSVRAHSSGASRRCVGVEPHSPLRRSRTSLSKKKPSTLATTPQLKEINEQIVDDECTLRTVDKRKAALEACRAMLCREIAALRIPITLEAFRTAPIRRVPTDILLEIFDAALAEDVQPVGTGDIPVLSQVCGQWREVACDHAVLWASFSCALLDVNLDQLYLQRSKAMPLTVEVHADRNHGPGTFSTQARIISLLAKHAERLYSLQLTGNDWSSIQVQGLRGKLPRLEILQLPSQGISSGQFELAPRLHTLILQGSYTNEPLPFSQIRSMHLQNSISPWGLAHFDKITALTCTLTEMAYMSHPNTGSPLVLRNLVSWAIDFGSALSTPPKFFDSYTAPALEELKITALSPKSNSMNIGGFVQRSRCSLKMLVLRASSVRIAEVLQIFECSPEAETFEVEDGPEPSNVTNRLFQALTVGMSAASVLLPRLVHLRVDGSYMYEDAKLLEMLESRTKAALAVSKASCDALESVKLRVENRAVKTTIESTQRDEGDVALPG
ncbi:hypothetical protein C8R43DRAFT_1114903 [Mycena crocata]|nr:hypothetical protein C8R43DRAFT_1114903 [Mycena crocata]